MSFRRRLKRKRPPEGWDLIESSIEDFESQMRDAVAEEHEGKRKNELTWRIHRVHWEKNRFLFDLRYKRKALSQELYDYLCREKIADQALISKWRKPGYENLCSLLSIQKGDTNFGTASICRVPMGARAPAQRLTPNVRTGCISCVSGDGADGGPIWWNTPITEAIQRKADGASKGKGKRAAEDEIDPEVRKRLAALKGEMAAGAGDAPGDLD
jgi:bud site selection protein 31